ncbi:MAG: hypothetical protein FWG64_12740 [Firmicutes bacterium]|nr:hypothetical protein [Bacillota bacterium]
MSQQVMLNIPMDSETKENVDNLFDRLGFNLTNAVNDFLRYCLQEEDVPFYDIEREKAEYAAKIARSEQQSREGKVTSFTFEELESLDDMESADIVHFLKTRQAEQRAERERAARGVLHD